MASLFWCLVVTCFSLGARGQGSSERGLPPASPCPTVYGYGWEPAGGWHGVVTILPPARFSEARLVFRMTVPYYRPEAGVGSVEIKGGNAEVQAISRRAVRGERHQIQFMIIFPPFDEIPRVKEVIINGKSFCSDTRVYPDTRSTIELKYVLRTGLQLPLASGNDFAIASNDRPSKPDLVTVAILVPWDEARPTGVSNPQEPSQPIGSGLQPPARPIGSDVQPPRPIGGGAQYPSRPIGTGGQASRPVGTGDQVSRPIGTDDHASRPIGGGAQYPSRPIGTGNASNHPCKCNKTNSQSSHNEVNEDPAFPSIISPENHVFHQFNPPGSNTQSQNENVGNSGNYFPSTTPNVTHPGGSGGHGGTHVTSPGSQRPGGVSSGSGSYFVPPAPTRKPGGNKHPLGSDHKAPLDDKIYFIMAESDEVNSPRVVKLLEHLLVVAKKHYQIDLERLEIEKKLLALQKNPHYTVVV